MNKLIVLHAGVGSLGELMDLIHDLPGGAEILHLVPHKDRFVVVIDGSKLWGDAHEKICQWKRKIIVDGESR